MENSELTNICTRLVNLRCEYSISPLGIDVENPLFIWEMASNTRGQYQTAYRVMVSANPDTLQQGIGDMWDSGRVSSPASAGVEYAGKPLVSGKKYWWTVTAWDKDEKKCKAVQEATFETGLLQPSDWKGKWLGFPAGMPGRSIYLRKEFEVTRPLQKARAYVTGIGYYQFYINGQKIGDHVLDPGATDYNKRVLYATYDVTGYLTPGKNVVGIEMGNGWYGAPKALLQMNIENSDGKKEEIFTDWGIGWHIAGGPITSNSIFDGETYDARLERTGWATPDYDFEANNHTRHGWIHATIVEQPGGKLVSQCAEPIKVIKDIEPVQVNRINETISVYDIGQNLSGWAKISVEGDSGAIITLRFGEDTLPDGTVNQLNLRTAEATDRYILKGIGMEHYAPRFTYHGFRYIQLEIRGKANIKELKAQLVHSAVASTGTFISSHALLNKIHENVRWTEVSNLQSIPTDCPQRDERQGWLNDATARAEEAVYNFDMARFYQKWLYDIADTQSEKGSIADTAPHRWGTNPADPLVSCYSNIPLMLWRFYGNKRVLKDHYAGLQKWMEYLHKYEAKDSVISRSTYGDWAPPAGCSIGDEAVSGHTPGALVSTGFYFLQATLMAAIAEILGLKEDQKQYQALSEKIKVAFNKKFFDAETGNYAGGSQGSNALALHFGLVPPESRKKVLQYLVNDIRNEHKGHLSTGNQCTKLMTEALSLLGEVETAFQVMTTETYPGYGFMIANGATTIWERWEYNDANLRMNSRSHPMHASIGAWFYKFLAGITVDRAPDGQSLFHIHPRMPQELSLVNASMQTVCGPLEAQWKKEGDNLIYTLSIPANSSAHLFIPEQRNGKPVQAVFEGESQLHPAANNNSLPEGILLVRQHNGNFEITIGSGSYLFTCWY